MTEVKVNFPGFLVEQNRNGSPRYRVRAEGQKGRKITIPVGPDDPDFANHYYAARSGETWHPSAPQSVERSLDWAKDRYLSFLEKMLSAGQGSKATLRQRRSILTRVCDHLDSEGDRYGDFDVEAPTSAFLEVRDAWADRPGAADNMIKTVKAMYAWLIERGMVKINPAAGIAPINTSPKGGAIPWTAADLKRFKDAYPKGTTQFLWLTLQAFTTCRIGDAIWLGRDQETTRKGQIYLEWQPRKKGSSFVSLPMLPPLFEATRTVKVVGPAYILGKRGRPYKTAESLRNQVRKWCDDAGLPDRSSHGIRKAMADLMAESGATQHQIMAVMSHTQAKTSEIYTKGVRRRILAEDGIRAIAALKW
ncbi:tyrosine-type recombinase/integrase [Falsiruegeria mediterranea]|uniref:tyrosine-type recombinase/integrase n=1 Tax=Falsiruegeria mediterranea TaxID=1280832 RepID=UPI0027BA04F5|nr:tyrosine-type recombinase/integrase [Falsiruegeria mediterranea]